MSSWKEKLCLSQTVKTQLCRNMWLTTQTATPQTWSAPFQCGPLPPFLSLTRTHIARSERRAGSASAHERDALKNKPSFGQSGFRWFGCSSKASSSLGQLIISMDARRWCSQVWCTSIKQRGSSAHGSRLQSHLSGLNRLKGCPVAVWTGHCYPTTNYAPPPLKKKK